VYAVSLKRNKCEAKTH